MPWAPGSQGEIVNRRFAPAPPVPAMEEPWRLAAAMAQIFWERVADDRLLTPDFAAMAGEALEVVRLLRRHVG